MLQHCTKHFTNTFSKLNVCHFSSRPTASEVLTTYLLQCNEPPWTSYFVKYISVKDDQFGMSNFNWKVGKSNYQILRTGCFPYIKYHCSRRKAENLVVGDRLMRTIKVLNLGGLLSHPLTHQGEPHWDGVIIQSDEIPIPQEIGPPRLPVYGSYWLILAQSFNNLSVAINKLSHKYKTKILGLYLGPFPAVIINDPRLIKEFLNNETLDGRTPLLLARLRSYWKILGIFFTDGYYWHVQRRFSLRHMRDFGFGRRDETLENVIAGEVKEMIDMRLGGPKSHAEKELVNGELVQLPIFFSAPFMNGIMHVLYKTTLPRPEYDLLWNMNRDGLLFIRNTDDLGRALCMTPWLKDVLPNWSGYNALRKGNQSFQNFFEKLIMDTKSTHDPSHDRHFVDMYITKMKEEARTNDKSTFTDDQLILTCMDYMLPTATALGVVLSMLVERMLLQPEIQDKIHEEIDRVVGRDRMPTLDDRKNMPYMESCIRETMRLETPVPLGLPHRAMADTHFHGYYLPENTVVAANYVNLHMDKEIWGDPETFRPERFIVDGQLKVSNDKSLPFGAGRRLCAGETYARQSMFQVLAAFMHTFRVATAEGVPLEKPLERIPGLITTIPEFWVRVLPRD